jgi:DNA phosphorothioation-dependent restriction protein DptH
MGAAFKSGSPGPNGSQLVVSRGDLGPWRSTINALHEKAVWVVCLDPLIDEKLMAFSDNDELHNKREIIGFASGFGSHGQLNYTISTEKASLHQIELGLRKQLNIILGPCPQHQLQNVAHKLVIESKNLSGLSLVNATGPSTYVHDLVGKTMTWMIRSEHSRDLGVILCDEMLSLDTFPHWFYKQDVSNRPDLLRIEAYLGDDGRIIVKAQVIEVKLRNRAMDAVDEAAV